MADKKPFYEQVAEKLIEQLKEQDKDEPLQTPKENWTQSLDLPGLNKYPSSSSMKKMAKTQSISEGLIDNWRARSIIGSLRGGQHVMVKQVFNPYTRKKSEYFDPSLQFGGGSV